MMPTNFNISWTGEYALVTSVTSFSNGESGWEGNGYLNSTQFNSTNPVVLAPFKKYTISLVGIEYILPNCTFILWTPGVYSNCIVYHVARDMNLTDIIIADGISGLDPSKAMFSFNYYQPQIITRDFSPPSILSSVTHVLSDIGGTLSFIDGLFALVFGRTIVAIVFGQSHLTAPIPAFFRLCSECAEHASGTRVVSPFGLLGVVTHNRFKHLIHEQFPRMQEDIERGGMAAYISEVAIDAALVDKLSATGHTTSVVSLHIADAEDVGENIELRNRQVGSSVSHLQLPYAVEEFRDPENKPLVDR